MTNDKAPRDQAGVGNLGSSVDLWDTITQEERSEVTYSESGKGRLGKGDGSQGLPTPDKVRKLQITLYRKAQSDTKYRFWSLYGEVLRADVLEAAWRRVAANKGAAGVDGQTIEEISMTPEHEAKWLEELRKELQSKTYRPSPVRRVMIPKASGGERPLGIPTVKDRVVQMAVYLVLMPIFEVDFDPRSFGFRPKRNAHQAIDAIREALRIGKTEVVDADISKYFDMIPHRLLLRQVAKRVSDGMILKLIKGWLRAPVMEEDSEGNKRMKANKAGTPQGGVISPLLANIYLTPLDKAVNGCREKPRLIRYADDLVIICRAGEGYGFKERLSGWLQARGLELNQTKTRLVDSRKESFAFLGYSFRWQRSRHGKDYVQAEASTKSQQAFRNRIREILNRSTTWKSRAEVVQEVNRMTRGWGNYFGHDNCSRVFGRANHFLRYRLRQWLWRKHGNCSGKYEKWPNEVLVNEYGLYMLRTSPSVRSG